ncbi:Rne/Rng family ribonuclease [Solitalea canadensis]|uniref:Ribonuclease, Rne/Rng family n=1 Tax=Solitalea canadensis (strain ATCC 29591 / DSM 3403 / JCM 21819 / LMG 8368 / NBRC 15130 / NCIMB 12057 / USAM 9D) TaxID=929556 RepID=H8KSH5_SOLCM|nr:Rne/Rng family ribonuclease [Solitalea canadensis]AFD08526.1 ribonuclease, Rne/Rng family [Solitalea canadensis DSM 3403]
MVKELLINSTPTGVTIALLKDKQLIELHQEQRNKNYAVGDIYLGRIKKIMPGLNAAFVDVGYEKDAFLHYLDLGPQVRSLLKVTKDVRNGNQTYQDLQGFKAEEDINKSGKISEVLSKNQLIPVQIAKEPISTKGPRLSSDISLAGRFVVLVPFSDTVSISKKIKSSAERMRLKKLIESIKPKNFGVIIRTVSEGKGVAELHADLSELASKWEEFTRRLKSTEPTRKVLGEIDRTSSILRDILNPDFQNIIVDDQGIYEEIRSYIHNIAPDQEKIVKLHKGRDVLFEHYGIEKQIKSSFGRTVNFHGGAYLIIESTEAMHVIDVNSGNRNASEDTQEENALLVNIEAAKEIARQLRLRDLGGIIVIDFIDMHKPANRKALYDALRREMSEDRAKHTILPPSKFGLVQITRQRVRPEMNIVTVEKCPTCNGTGEVKATITLIDDVQNNLQYILEEQNEDKITLCVHPYIAAFLTKGWYSIRMKWFFKYRKWVKIKAVTSYTLTEYHFFNPSEEEISF